MAEGLNSISELESLERSVTYHCLNKLNGRFTVTVDVDDNVHFGYGFSLDAAKNDAATNALASMKTADNTTSENRNAFYMLKEKRKGLIFQSIRKKKGLFDVTVQVDFVKYFGKGETQSKANNVCSANVLAAFDSGDHERSTQALYKNAFNTLKEMYSGLSYQGLSASEDGKVEVYVNVDGIDYFGEAGNIHEANNDAAWAVLKSIWSGDHQKMLDEKDEYWYDDDDYSTSASASSEYYLPLCNCTCHSCSCCQN